jgi:hypothetical protein
MSQTLNEYNMFKHEVCNAPFFFVYVLYVGFGKLFSSSGIQINAQSPSHMKGGSYH